MTLDRAQRFYQTAFVRRGAVAMLVHSVRGLDDRTIAGAAAQVARQRVVDIAPSRPARRLVEREQRHHEAGRAKAALRAVALDHRLLHRMQSAVLAAQAFDGDKRLAVERWHELDARIDSAIAQRAVVDFRRDNGARAAIAFGAAFFRARASAIFAQVLKHGARRIHVAERDDLAVERKTDRALL